MSKELTEQLRNGTLEDGLYYALTSTFRFNEELVIERAINGVLYTNNGIVDFNVKEVLAKVPTYDQFVELTEKIEELEWRKEELEQQNAFECECNKEYADTLKKNEQLEKLLKECKSVINEYIRSDYIKELKERIDVVLRKERKDD